MARELARGGPLLAYHLPLFGPPWSAPLEFPLYQAVVAGVSKVTGLGIEKSGRLVGLFSGVMALIAVVRLVRIFDLPLKTQVLTVVMIGGSPIFFYWSQSVMIEVFTLSLCLWMTVAAAEFVKRGLVWPLAYGVICAIGAAMAKATTFAIFAIVIFLMFAAIWLVRAIEQRQTPIKVLKMSAGWFLYGVILFVPALLLANWYIDYGDAIKEASPLTQFLTSESLERWNYGSPEQLKKALSYTVLPFRDNGPAVFQQGMGLGWIVLFALAFAGYLLNLRRLVMGLVLACGFVAGPAIFSNLYEVHYYYWIANILFAIGFILIGISSGLEFLARRFGNNLSNFVAAGLCVAYIGSTLPVLHDFFLAATLKQNPALAIVGETVQEVTDPDGIIYVFGFDWNPAVQYYADRFALMARDPNAALAFGAKAGVHPAAAVFCGPERQDNVIDQRLITPPLSRFLWSPANDKKQSCRVFKNIGEAAENTAAGSNPSYYWSWASGPAAVDWTFGADIPEVSAQDIGMRVTTPANSEQIDVFIRSPKLYFNGNDYTRILVDIECIKPAATNDLNIYYMTSEHGESSSFRAVPRNGQPLTAGERRLLEYDMTNLFRGGDDWVSSGIERVRFDFPQGPDSEYVIYSLRICDVRSIDCK